MLVAHIKDCKPEFAQQSQTTLSIAELQELYRAAKQKFDTDREFKVRAKREVVRLQAGSSRSGYSRPPGSPATTESPGTSGEKMMSAGTDEKIQETSVSMKEKVERED